MIMRLAFLLVALAAMLAPGAAEPRYGAPAAEFAAHLERLRHAYPKTIKGVDDGALALADGSRIAISDGRTDKSFDELLDAPDIDDMFAFPYPAGALLQAPPRNFDPGRVRVQALFLALYGDCRKGEVAPRLRNIRWVPAHGGGTVAFTTAQGADRALEAVSRDLDRLPKRFTKYLTPSAGTYNCRTIAGTDRLSVHAYGAAIDLNVKHSAYWRWARADAAGNHRWTNQIPVEIVDIFERHGFVWGGRWYHFDTMHFEYRPELLAR